MSLAVVWDRLHDNHDDVNTSHTTPTTCGVSLSGAALRSLFPFLDDEAVQRLSLSAIDGCTSVDVRGDVDALRQIAQRLASDSSFGDSLRDAVRSALHVPSDSMPLQFALVCAQSPRSSRDKVLDCAVVSVLRLPIASFRTANSVADVAMRGARQALALAFDAERAVAFVLNAPVEQPALGGESRLLDLARLAAQLAPSSRAAATMAAIGHSLQQAGFQLSENGRLARRPKADSVSFFVVLTRGYEAHEVALEALEQVLARNWHGDALTVLNRAPPPPVDALFVPDVAATLRRGDCDRTPLLHLAVQQVERTATAHVAPLAQLLDFGLDPDAAVNAELVRVLKNSTLLDVRAMARAHVIATNNGERCVCKVPLGDDVQDQAGDHGQRHENGGDNDEARYELRVRGSDQLLRQLRAGELRREQLATIDAVALFGTGADANSVVLFHGTTIGAATSVVNDGPRIPLGAKSHDFGSAMYCTPDLAFALETAYEVSGGRAASGSRREMDPAVVAFIVPQAHLDAIVPTLHLTGAPNATRWQQLVCGCLHESTQSMPNQLRDDYEEARLVVGPIVGNGRHVTAGQAAIALQAIQFAFKETRQLRVIGRGANPVGRIVVLRLVNHKI